VSESGQPDALQPWQRVHREFLGTLRALAHDETALKAALGGGTVEQLVNGLLARTCASHGLELTEFFRHFERDRSAQRQLEAVMRVVLAVPAIVELRRPGLLEEVKRELLLLRFALSGAEPPAEVWAAIEPAEQMRIRGAAGEMRGSDPLLLGRVEKALGRGEAFGICEACSQPIPVGRLQLVAAAERCAPCQSKLEGEPEVPPPAAQVVHFHPRAGAPLR
jgi:RNA polymerase-binding transcription factor DksA